MGVEGEELGSNPAVSRQQRAMGRAEIAEALGEILSRPGLSRPERIDELLALGCRLFETSLGLVGRIEAERYELLHVISDGDSPARGAVLPAQRGLPRRTFASSGPVLAGRAAAELATHPCLDRRRVATYAGVALTVKGKRYGVLEWVGPVPLGRAFHPHEVRLVERVGSWIGEALGAMEDERALRSSEALHRDLVDNSSDLIGTHDLDGTLLSANRVLVESLGMDSPDAVIGRNLAEFLVPEVRPRLADYLEEIRTRGKARGLMRIRDRRGRERILEYHNTLRREGVVRPVVRGTARDVTELKRAEAQLRQSEARLRVFVRHTPAAVAMFDRDFRYLVVSDRWRTEHGLEGVELEGRSHYEVFPEMAEHWRQIHRRCLEGATHLADEDPIAEEAGEMRWMRWAIHTWPRSPDEIGGFVLFTEDITDRKRVENALRYLATHDHLTGLLNRAAFLERLERSSERSRRSEQYGFALLFLDLDGFKAINDSHGHGAGDEVLEQIAARLGEELRPKDALARFAGDEFVILLEDLDSPRQAVLVTERILERIGEPIVLTDQVLSLTASAGIAMAGHGASAEELLRRADAAMYAAKGAGGGICTLAGEEGRGGCYET